MRQIVSTLAIIAALTVPVHALAETSGAADPDPKAETETSEGLSLMQRGAELFLRGLREDLDPVVEDMEEMAQALGPKMQELLTQMGPRLAALLDRIDDVAYYGKPEILPNGDILIPRRPDAPPYIPGDPLEETPEPPREIEL